ncbi:MAG: Flp pilus assembly complex ATPase component TadA [Clostridium sp.]|nr:Flp pilus assembly complex ATPase component TadA [Clostridium sp.]
MNQGVRKNQRRILDYESLKQEVIAQIGHILHENPYESVRKPDALKGMLKFRRDLRIAMKNCVVGNYDAKLFIRDFMKEILVVKLKVNEELLDKIFRFRQSYLMTAQDKFAILLYQYEKRYDKDALGMLIEQYHLGDKKISEDGESYYEISVEDINQAYQEEGCLLLNFVDKISIAAQKIYEDTKGNGPIDMLFHMRLDGISGGVSGHELSVSEFQVLDGQEYSYQSIWIYYSGKSIHMSFLKFPSEKEFIRICKNIYRYRSPGQLSQVRGYMVNEMADGSRVAVARPPFSENWVFFIRKFNSVVNKDMDKLLLEPNRHLPIRLIEWLIKGCQILAVTGEQGSGKTTLLMSMVRFIKPTYNLRIQELAFELHLKKLYPKRNIVSFRETTSVSGQEGLDFQKKTDGTVNILGEVASNAVCSWLIQMAQVASKFTIFTHHAKTTKDLVYSFRNALLMDNGFQDERIAMEQVVHVLNFDIHMRKAEDGHRYIERISEIIVLEENQEQSLQGKMFEVRDLLVYKEGKYQVSGIISERAQRRILAMLESDEKQEFLLFLHEWREQYGSSRCVDPA